jgi:uncharacterized membrane protein YdjX (TVP38/TMEM64 family)
VTILITENKSIRGGIVMGFIVGFALTVIGGAFGAIMTYLNMK